jgi:hypothetical protein
VKSIHDKKERSPRSLSDPIFSPNMYLNAESPLNQGVLNYLGRGDKAQNALIAASSSVVDPYMGQGSHQYNLRLTAADFEKAILLGANTKTRWSDGVEMDAREVLGPNWIFGGWYSEETQWSINMCEEAARRPCGDGGSR